MITSSQKVPFRLFQTVYWKNSIRPLIIRSIYWVADEWRADCFFDTEPEKLYALSLIDLSATNPKEYATTKIYRTKTGTVMAILIGGKL